MANRIRYDVNDAALREGFLREGCDAALAGLKEDARPHWGALTPQQMVEHLLWAVEGSLGAVQVECHLPPERIAKAKAFLYDDRPMPHEFANPALVDGLPALRFESLAQAQAALRQALAHFLESAARGEGGLRVHPMFGPLDAQEWHRIHFKHCVHHLLQFGLIETE